MQDPSLARIGAVLFNDPAMGILKETIVLWRQRVAAETMSCSNYPTIQPTWYASCPLDEGRFGFFKAFPLLGKSWSQDDPSRDPVVTQLVHVFASWDG